VQPVALPRPVPVNGRPEPRKIPRLADFDRLRQVLGKYELDAVVCAQPINVHYLSGLDSPALWEFPWYAFAVVPRVGEPALVTGQLQLSAPVEVELWIKDIYTFARSDIIVYDASAMLETEMMVYEVTQQSMAKRAAGQFEALTNALADRGLTRGKVGFDDSRLIPRIPDVALSGFDGIDVMREVRMIKTPPELDRMRRAAKANEDSAMEAVLYIPQASSWDDIVVRYKANLAMRGGEAKYMIGGAPHHTGTFQHQLRDYPLRRGDFFMIDALGAKEHYLGDFGRTLSWGEPSPKLLDRYNAMRRGFEAGLEMAKPGVRFDALAARVVEVVRSTGLERFVACTPHSVGMEHTDMPRVPGHVLHANMVLNIDIAYMEAGFGGMHLEDTFLVTQTGTELLTSGKSEMLVL
jgi:Xaa-Pro aminopeptidase